jgi:[ribosomal protein S18]-alanine N-acetyltransferase
MPVTIRLAMLDDVPALLAIEQEAASAAHWTREQYARLVESGIVLVAEEAGNISGFVCAKTVAGDWEVENLVVAKRGRRRGIGSGLLDELLRRARNDGSAAVWLEVRESNQPARRLYERHGFHEAGRRLGYYRDLAEDAVLYEFRFKTNDSVGMLKP